jgi:GMP reductase
MRFNFEDLSKNEYELNYDDIFLIPKKSIVKSRSECDTSIKLGKRTFDLPVVPSNMKSVVDYQTCLFLAQNNIFYIMHRIGTDMVDFCNYMKENNQFVSISVGINEDAKDQVRKLIDAKIDPDYINIDVANGWSDFTPDMIKLIKDNFTSFLIVGNCAISEAVQEITSWGADAVRVGIGGGKSCITRYKTGFYRPMVSTLLDCAKHAEVPIIADGGVRENGDIAKAIACGASMCMIGAKFAGYEQSAGNIVEVIDIHESDLFASTKDKLIGHRFELGKFVKEYTTDYTFYFPLNQDSTIAEHLLSNYISGVIDRSVTGFAVYYAVKVKKVRTLTPKRKCNVK